MHHPIRNIKSAWRSKVPDTVMPDLYFRRRRDTDEGNSLCSQIKHRLQSYRPPHVKPTVSRVRPPSVAECFSVPRCLHVRWTGIVKTGGMCWRRVKELFLLFCCLTARERIVRPPVCSMSVVSVVVRGMLKGGKETERQQTYKQKDRQVDRQITK